MKVTADGIMGSAARIRSQINIDKKDDESKSSVDKVEIGNRVNIKLDDIDTELKNIQNSLTKNQIAKAALKELSDDISSNGKSAQDIVNNFKYDDKPVLSDILSGKEINDHSVKEALKEINSNISMNVARLTQLTIETENIFASNLAGIDKVDKVIKNTETIYVHGDVSAQSRLSSLNADIVMKLVK